MAVEWEIHASDAIVFDFGAVAKQDWEIGEYIEVIGGGIAEYDGDYESTPKWSEQVYQTKNKAMRDDFTVHSITELEVINEAGGLTLTI